MPDNYPTNPVSAPHQDDFQIAFSRLPDYVQSWMCSAQTTQINADIIKKYGLPKEKSPLLAALIGDIFFKEIIIEKLPEAIQQELSIDYALAEQIAIDEGILMFLPIREYLRGIESAILSWGGQLPATLPPKPSIHNVASPISSAQKIEQRPEKAEQKTQKTLREIAKDNKEIMNQSLTNSSLKITEFEQPVRGTIKNWLADYVRQKGAGKHNEMVRSDYLFKSDNAKNLTPEEKTPVAELLKSYDEDSLLPYDEDKKIIILEQLGQSTIKIPAPSARPTPGAPTSAYREAIEEKDLSGPLGKISPKPAPRLSGNIIDLKDIS